MTEFKQIVGRGTRIREDYQKLYFTIMDFKGATRLFRDPDFDGDPVTIYEPGVDDPIIPPDDLDSGNDESEPDDDFEGGGGSGPGPVSEPRLKYVLDNVNVRPGVERVQYLDADGQLKTESYQVFIKEQIKRSLLDRFTSLEDFLNRWTKAERKQVIVNELNEIGIDFEVLQNAVPNADEFDVFDLVSHIAWDAKPLIASIQTSRSEKSSWTQPAALADV